MSEVTVDPAALDRLVDHLCAVMRSHGGAIELQGVDSRGVVRVRFTDACSGCAFRPLTFESTIRPTLMSLEGVTDVVATGARISDEALARARSYFGDAPTPQLPRLELANLGAL